jgi:TPR repeat protein
MDAVPRKPVTAISIVAPPTRQIDRDEIAMLLKRGEAALENGDTAAARLLLRRAAEAGEARAAIALAATYDPHTLRRLGAIGADADVAQAETWYRKASELGSAEAAQRLQQLARQAQ